LAFVFPTATGQPIEAHNFERDVLVPAAIRAGIMPKLAKDRKKGDPRRDKATAVNFQAFRRTYGTWMQRTGASVKDAQGAMRHASPDQTLRVYMREIPDGSRMAIDALELLYDAKCGLAAGTPRGAAN
jgi:integrase